MRFTTYLKSKQKLLVIWFCIHSFALFVNAFGIEGKIFNSDVRSGPNRKITNIYLFAYDYSDKDYLAAQNEHKFWPFVNPFRTFHYGSAESNYIEDSFEFMGLFYCYNLPEFIFYSVLIFIILYFIWNSKYSKTKPIT